MKILGKAAEIVNLVLIHIQQNEIYLHIAG
jgi:hypothetical protein